MARKVSPEKEREAAFKDRFAAAFLASWCADNYGAACATGNVKVIENPPAEDAIHLAGFAWIAYNKFKDD